MATPLTLSAWNRTVLHRQHLTERIAEDAIEVLDRCVGLQSQDPRAAFYGLASRIGGFEPDELDDLLTSREVVRMASLRGTVFLMDAEDTRWIRPLVQPVLDASAAQHRKRLRHAEHDAVVDAAADLLDGAQLSVADLKSQLAQRFPDEDSATLATLARCALALVQVPPRGLWAGRGAPTYQLFDDWVGPGEPAISGTEAVKELIRLYLRGFGPATVKGIQTWCGLTGLKATVETMEKDWELERLTGPDGIELYDLDGLGIVDDAPAPARLIAPYDNVIMASADRRRIDPDDLYRTMATPNGLSPGFVLVDGFLCGSWSFDANKRVVVNYAKKVDARSARAVDDEVARLQEFCDC